MSKYTSSTFGNRLNSNGLDEKVQSHPIDDAQVETCLAYLRLLKPIKTPTKSSYSLKHYAERWGRLNGMSPYVSNGALLMAADHLGLTIKQPYHGFVNANIGVSVRDVNRISAEIKEREHEAAAQSRR